MTRARILLALGVLTYGVLGLWSLILPEGAASLVDLGLTTPTARTDFMAVYGGFELGFAAFLGWCARRSDRVGPGLAALGLGLLASGLARLAGVMTASGPVHPLMTAALVSELIGAAFCVLCARRLPRA